MWKNTYWKSAFVSNTFNDNYSSHFKEKRTKNRMGGRKGVMITFVWAVPSVSRSHFVQFLFFPQYIRSIAKCNINNGKNFFWVVLRGEHFLLLLYPMLPPSGEEGEFALIVGLSFCVLQENNIGSLLWKYCLLFAAFHCFNLHFKSELAIA